ncbi:MAG: hypothetical protein QOE48_6096 [Mycobacterium sp.]|nr:hypothetical protein [Mycobacterium sp.]
MNAKIAKPRVVLAAVTAIAAAGLLALPSAHATANCTVLGELLNLHDSGGYDVAIDASGSSLGPRAVIRTPELTSDGNITSGGITGRTVDFTIGWSGTLSYVHFTGTVGADGIAHGTSTGTTTPINLNEGPWDSVGPLTCS